MADILPLLRVDRLGHVNLAELARLEVRDHVLEERAAAALGADLDHAVVVACRLDHPPPFDDVVAARLLDVDVLSRLAREDRRQGVPVVGDGDDQAVDLLVVEDRGESR